ncbi:MAG: AI-2E family transporter [Candidatus Thalassarchaeaceae archaeon]|nr:AI-2E family transporter [Candidatus Thalassarchaeaceae archaeon]
MSQFTDDFGARLKTLSNGAIFLAILVLALIHLRSVIEPFIIAIFIYFLLAPGAHWLNDRGVPLFPAYALVVGALAGTFILVGMWLYQDVSSFAEGIPEYSLKLDELVAKWEGKSILGFTLSLEGLSVSSEQLESTLLSTFGEIGNFLSLMITVFVFLIFIIFEAETLPSRVAAAYPTEINDHLKEMIVDMSDGVYRYVRVKTIVSFGTAFVTAIILFTMGVPGWFLWSALTFILNYVPIIGSLIAMIPPSILAILLLDPTVAIAVITVLIVNQQIWGQFIENKMFGSSLDISPIVLLLVTVFWYWLWGIMGMVLAIPMAVVAKIILSKIPETRPISILLSERAPTIEEE